MKKGKIITTDSGIIGIIVVDSHKSIAKVVEKDLLTANHMNKIGKHSKRKYWESPYKFK